MYDDYGYESVEYEGQGPKDKLYYEVQKMCLFDNVFMNHVFYKDPGVAEKVLHILMGREDFHVLKVNIEHKIPNFLGLEPRLDVECIDEKGNLFDIEVQNEVEEKEILRRARYYSALGTSTLLPKGSGSYCDLKDTVVIFILRTWIKQKGKDTTPFYHIEHRIAEEKDEEGNNLLAEDGEHILLVNGEYLNGEDPLGRLMQDFSCLEPQEMHYNWLRDKVSSIKATRSDIVNLTREERLKREGIRHDTTMDNARALIRDGIKLAVFSKSLKLSEEDIETLRKEFEGKIPEGTK